ncbi:ABC transporter substrate-binding protein [Streptomyces fractus]|uniref:ABC transporter substrate-binding protein n=1 Tax=Streptomyces fractus TaxID=641806 RepID=UPI003CFB7FBC
MRGRRTDRRNWRWLPRRLRFRVLGLIDVIALWVLVGALVGGGAWWGVDTYLDHRNYCSDSHELRRTGAARECIGVTEGPDAFGQELDPDVKGVMGRIARENEAARNSGKEQVSVAVVMPYTQETAGAAMSRELILHSLEGAYLAQREFNKGSNTKDRAIRLVFANVGEYLRYWAPVTRELADRLKDKDAPLVAAIGFPNSDSRTLDAVRSLAKHRIPSVSAALSANGMENQYLFKVSPSNRQFAEALKGYVDANGMNRAKAFMIADSRKDDDYVTNLRQVFYEEFGADYGISHDPVDGRIGRYQGKKGPQRGKTGVFGQAVDAMCSAGTRTVFLAGRDADLEPFLQSIRTTPSCGRAYPKDDPLRILRVSTGRDPHTESPVIRSIADSMHIQIVTAVAVDAPRWSHGGAQAPGRFRDFATAYKDAFAHERGDALNDGYAAMYHDALAAVNRAVYEAYKDGGVPVTHDDVNRQLGQGSPSEKCAQCVPAATGDFTFADELEGPKGHWPVCKPIPIVTFPKENRSKSPLYRTYESGRSKCPAP